jgi:hypothetical protein
VFDDREGDLQQLSLIGFHGAQTFRLGRTRSSVSSADDFTSDRKPATLSNGQPEPPATELLLQDPILLAEILDDRILLAANPAGHGGNKDLPRLEHRCHP